MNGFIVSYYNCTKQLVEKVISANTMLEALTIFSLHPHTKGYRPDSIRYISPLYTSEEL